MAIDLLNSQHLRLAKPCRESLAEFLYALVLACRIALRKEFFVLMGKGQGVVQTQCNATDCCRERCLRE